MMHAQTQESFRKACAFPEISHLRLVLNVHKKTHIAKLEFRNIY